jgi:hypothetical protein
VTSGQTGFLYDGSWRPGYCCSNFPPIPQPVSGPPYTATLNSAVVRITSGGIIPNATWGQNIVICGNKATGAEPWPDQSQGDCDANAALMPSGDRYPLGATQAARETAAGVSNVALNDYTCTPTAANPCAAGTNFQGLKADLGIVANIGVEIGTTSLQFNYVAPDSRACSVDVSSDGSTWTRGSDSGGSRVRTLTILSLLSGKLYQYRLLCYYDQTTSYFSFPSEKTSMTTSGSISTAPAGTRTLNMSFVLPAGAATVRFTVTGIGASPVSQTCSASPCGIAGVPFGNAAVQATYFSGSGTAVASGSFVVE